MSGTALSDDRAAERPIEHHRSHRSGWLRAAVLGANDGIVSTAALIVGVAAASSDRGQILTAGVAGLVAGAASMAAGEYVSVSSQVDVEQADLALEVAELRADPTGEQEELAAIYRARGLSPQLADAVAAELSAKGDLLAVHARDELGMTELSHARPFQAAASSAVAFTAGAMLPLLAAILAPTDMQIEVTMVTTAVALALAGATGARLGGASPLRGALRVAAWGVAAMLLTMLVGRTIGTAV
jgi:vacuolar iron transporter family protein